MALSPQEAGQAGDPGCRGDRRPVSRCTLVLILQRLADSLGGVGVSGWGGEEELELGDPLNLLVKPRATPLCLWVSASLE